MANQPQMANAIRALAMDAVQQANSGHPGAPMGMADMAVALWGEHLQHNPQNPTWANRDRFVLSNGHGSMLIYALLHLTGYKLPIEELRNFRQLHSKTAGHPEAGITPGVETTTGPLGQGVTNAVGMALAEKLLAAEFNRPGHCIVNHHTYVFLGDGCLMEGISHEAIALAGAWKLHKLIALYDDNGISIDGQVTPWFIDNTPQRFAACGWNVIDAVDGHDAAAVSKAIASAKHSADKPTLIVCKTSIGKGSPNRAGTAKAHGEPLGAEEVRLTREALGWTAEPFRIPKEVYADWDAKAAGKAREAAWNQAFAAYKAAHPALAKEFVRRMQGDLPKNFHQVAFDAVVAAHTQAETVASRKASQIALEAFTAALPELLGGSADLTGSNLTTTKSTPAFRVDLAGDVVKTERRIGRHINYGVREFGMAAIMNGVALHGGFIPYGGTFLTFSDYSRNAIRMAALMKQRVIHVFTHDSIGLGEDGPTHQSIEHTPSLRLIPGLDVWRPADTAETAVAWAVALQNANRPSALCLSRQNLAYAPKADLGDISRGAYVLSEPADVGMKKTHGVIIATGSEVQLALAAQKLLAERKIGVRVVSMPSTNVFDRQSTEYKHAVLPA
ncbi:MAG: transketolase, partial [Limnohabitans sp.]